LSAVIRNEYLLWQPLNAMEEGGVKFGDRGFCYCVNIK